MGAGIQSKELDDLACLRMAKRPILPSAEQDEFGIWRLTTPRVENATIYVPPNSNDIVDLWARVNVGDLVCPTPLVSARYINYPFVATIDDIYVLVNIEVDQDSFQCKMLPASGGDLRFVFYRLPRRWVIDVVMGKSF